MTYKINNYAPDSTNFPALIPPGQYLAKIEFYLLGNKLAGTIDWYVKLKEVTKW